MVGTHVTAAAGVGRAGNAQGKSMPVVTSAARALTAVGIDAADSAVGPGRRVEFSVFGHFNLTAMALLAARNRRRPPLDDFSQHIVKRTDKRSGVGVAAVLLFFKFSGVAAAAVFRGNYRRDRIAVMLKNVGFHLFRPMAVIAADFCLRVPAGLPLVNNKRSYFSMAGDAGLALLLGHGRCSRQNDNQ